MTSRLDWFAKAVDDLYVSERQVLDSLPAMVAAADSPRLRTFLERQVVPITIRLIRLRTVLALFKRCPSGSPDTEAPVVRPESDEPGVVFHLARLVRYRATLYNRAGAFAQRLGLDDVAVTLLVNLVEVVREGRALEGLSLPAPTLAPA